jgi:2-C-methyl-D-erythritol 4-phosphate cytidylyltransferase/2-C-methyl-D-erythritol 2,4-cyclodiphosphate synthase
MSATYALIPAAGRSARFSTSGDSKVFAPLRGCPLLRWTVSAFAAHDDVDGIVIVIGAEDVARCREALMGIDKMFAIVVGGETRQASVQIGLFTLGAALDDIVLVHDGARPLVSAAIIDRCIAGVRVNNNAVAALPISDTLKRTQPSATGEIGTIVTETLDRENVWAMQTPQAFRYETLLHAHVAAHDAQFVGTDEAALVEHLGDGAVYLVPGATENIKVTRPEDLALAEALLEQRLGNAGRQVRVGFGYDIHRLVPGRRLVLGGVEIPDPEGRGLEGHSDADVLLHALCDALLGAAGLADIGTLYPNTDPAFAGIASIRLLADVAARLRQQNFTVVNVDMTVIAEAPKVAPYVGRMREIIAAQLGLEPARVGIKATTNEGLGALGQEEGIAAHAVASLISC